MPTTSLVGNRDSELRRPEPADRLAKGRAFEQAVKARLAAEHDELLVLRFERGITDLSERRGRIDAFLGFDHDEVGERQVGVIYELKRTFWDKIADHRIRPNVLRVARQIWRYIEAVVENEGLYAQAFVVFPVVPQDEWRRRVVELLFAERGIMVLWEDVQLTTPVEFLAAADEDAPDILSIAQTSIPGVMSDPAPPAPGWLEAACAGGRDSRAAMGQR